MAVLYMNEATHVSDASPTLHAPAHRQLHASFARRDERIGTAHQQHHRSTIYPRARPCSSATGKRSIFPPSARRSTFFVIAATRRTGNTIELAVFQTHENRMLE
jgi:hypothetical protein